MTPEEEGIDLPTGLELLPREYPYRGCPICQAPMDWSYSKADVARFGLGAPVCVRHGRMKGWIVVEGEALQKDFLTGGFVTKESGWVEVS